jgi:hypothetical protein
MDYSSDIATVFEKLYGQPLILITYLVMTKMRDYFSFQFHHDFNFRLKIVNFLVLLFVVMTIDGTLLLVFGSVTPGAQFIFDYFYKYKYLKSA